MQKLAVYVHFPFCLSKCGYCAFYSVVFDQNLYHKVIDKIIADINQSKNILGERDIISIFFGGGTPSLMLPEDIHRIINAISTTYHLPENIEITLESNPDTLDLDKLIAFRQAGINRMSVGCQSFIDNELQFLGRRCNASVTKKAIKLISDQFENFNIDLIYGFPIQTENSLQYSINEALSFSPTHMSCYKLTFEPKTVLYNKLQSGQISDITEEEDVQLFDLIINTLSLNNFTRYEVSNFAKKGFECKHNCAYWTYNDYIGIGAAAHSRVTIDNRKYAIEYPKNIQRWLKINAEPLVELTEDEVCAEAIIMGLRTRYGINVKYLKNIIKSPKFIELLDQKILYQHNNHIVLNTQYMNLCDYILSIITE